MLFRQAFLCVCVVLSERVGVSQLTGFFSETGHGAMELQLPPLCALFDGQRDMTFISIPTAKHTHENTHKGSLFPLLCCEGEGVFSRFVYVVLQWALQHFQR